MSDEARELEAEKIRAALRRAADLAADYLTGGVERYPVRPRLEPGELGSRLPVSPPASGEPLDRILDDYVELIEPNVTHWNHPGFLAYFAITGSAPGVMAETLSAALNVNAMLWRTSPAATELEERACDWLRQMLDLPEGFRGHINDTASISTLLALAAAREAADLDVRQRGLAGRPDLPRLCIYASDQAHSSVDKAAMTLGLGLDGVRRLAHDESFRLDPGALREAIDRDRAEGLRPLAVVATVGTTSTTSVDPLPEVAEICREYGLWLHVDGAYGGCAAICPELRETMPGLELADSVVVNPHKWLLVPIDCSVLFLRDQRVLEAAFSLIPPYLRSDEAVTNLMDLGVQLGRRFRALKLWMVVRAYGVEGLQERIREDCARAREVADWIRREAGWEVVAPVPMSVVCFRARFDGADSAAQDELNRRLLERVNTAGPVLLSPTELDGRFVLRIAIGNEKTERRHLEEAWRLLREAAIALREELASQSDSSGAME